MNSNLIQVAGIDPSMRNMGTARAWIDPLGMEIKVSDLRLFTTEARDKKVVRKNSDDLRRARELRGALHIATTNCAVAMVEVPTGSQSARAAWSLGLAVGVLASCPVPMIEVTPTEVKIATVGKKTASKDEMIEWAMWRHPDAPWLTRKVKGAIVPVAANEHLADAVAVLYAGALTEQFGQMVAAYRAARAM